MKNVVFVAPYFLDATERFISAATKTPAARVGLVSCDPVEKLNPEIRARLAGYCRIDSIGTREMLRGVEQMGSQLGTVDRLLGMLEQIQEPLGQIRDRLGIAGIGGEVASNFRDKARMKTVLKNAGLPCARHGLVDSVQAGLEFSEQVGFPLIVKPPDGAGAKSTFRCEDAAQLTECLKQIRPDRSKPIMIEEFITGDEYSLDSVFVGGRLAWTSISHYFPTPLEVVRQPWIQWCVLIPREDESPDYAAIRQVAEPALQALGMQTGLSHMEWFRRNDGSVAISEVGARPPGAQFTSLISYAHDFDFYRGWAQLLIHEAFDPPRRKYSCGAAYLRAMGRGRISRTHGLENIASELGDIVVESQLPKPGQPTSDSYEGDGFIIVRHEDTEKVKSALWKIINSIRVDAESMV